MLGQYRNGRRVYESETDAIETVRVLSGSQTEMIFCIDGRRTICVQGENNPRLTAGEITRIDRALMTKILVRFHGCKDAGIVFPGCGIAQVRWKL